MDENEIVILRSPRQEIRVERAILNKIPFFVYLTKFEGERDVVTLEHLDLTLLELLCARIILFEKRKKNKLEVNTVPHLTLKEMEELEELGNYLSIENPLLYIQPESLEITFRKIKGDSRILAIHDESPFCKYVNLFSSIMVDDYRFDHFDAGCCFVFEEIYKITQDIQKRVSMSVQNLTITLLELGVYMSVKFKSDGRDSIPIKSCFFSMVRSLGDYETRGKTIVIKNFRPRVPFYLYTPF